MAMLISIELEDYCGKKADTFAVAKVAKGINVCIIVVYMTQIKSQMTLGENINCKVSFSFSPELRVPNI